MPASVTAAVEKFERQRPLLFSIAHRMLGSASEAEDAVQDASLRYDAAGPAAVLETAEQRDDVSTALLILLERPAPRERAVLVLREAFAYRYRDLAAVLGTSEANCRQLHSRARRTLATGRARFDTSSEQRRQRVERFVAAAAGGDLAGLEALLTEDVTVVSDSGGQVPRPAARSSAATRPPASWSASTSAIGRARRAHWPRSAAGPASCCGRAGGCRARSPASWPVTASGPSTPSSTPTSSPSSAGRSWPSWPGPGTGCGPLAGDRTRLTGGPLRRREGWSRGSPATWPAGPGWRRRRWTGWPRSSTAPPTRGRVGLAWSTWRARPAWSRPPAGPDGRTGLRLDRRRGPLDAAEVAARLAALAGGDPAGRVPDMGGPEVRTAGDLAPAFLRASGRRRTVVGVPLPGRVARGFRSGGHLAPDHATGTRTWEQFLARRGPGNPTGCPGGSGEAGGTGLT